jgi:redox-sensitive bicupin YhaK (pirin superfamily)
VLEGKLEMDGQVLLPGQAAHLQESDPRRFVAVEPTRAICFGGDFIGPRYLWWNFVHSRKERIEEEKVAWRERRHELPADDRDDIIPLPADHERPLRVINQQRAEP